MKPNILRRAMLAGAIATSSMIGITAATPGCTPASPRCGVAIIAASVCSIVRAGSERNPATPARVLSASA